MKREITIAALTLLAVTMQAGEREGRERGVGAQWRASGYLRVDGGSGRLQYNSGRAQYGAVNTNLSGASSIWGTGRAPVTSDATPVWLERITGWLSDWLHGRDDLHMQWAQPLGPVYVAQPADHKVPMRDATGVRK